MQRYGRHNLKTRKRQADTEESRRKRAVDLIYKHNIGKGINILEGFGRADPDDPAIRQQMLDKHPAPAAEDPLAEDWPELPEHWFGIAQESVSSDAMLTRIANVIRETVC